MKKNKVILIVVLNLFLNYFQVMCQDSSHAKTISLLNYKTYDLDSFLVTGIKLTDRNYCYDIKHNTIYYRNHVHDSILNVIDLNNETYSTSKIKIPVQTTEDLYSCFLIYKDTLYLIISSPYDDKYGMRVLYYKNFNFHEKFKYLFNDSKPPAFDMCYSMNNDSICFQDLQNCEITHVYKDRPTSRVKNEILWLEPKHDIINNKPLLPVEDEGSGCQFYTRIGILRIHFFNNFTTVLESNGSILLKIKNNFPVANLKMTNSGIYGIRNHELSILEIDF